jgi:hypothetical protein
MTMTITPPAIVLPVPGSLGEFLRAMGFQGTLTMIRDDGGPVDEGTATKLRAAMKVWAAREREALRAIERKESTPVKGRNRPGPARAGARKTTPRTSAAKVTRARSLKGRS